MLCRLGEAANPGPQTVFEPQIGCINPNGILGKCNSLKQVPSSNATIWAVSETHLTSHGNNKLKIELAAQSCGYNMQMGADVAPKSQTVSAVGGKQLGVGFLTSLPCRSMTRTWEDDQWKGCRVHASCFQVGARWIQGGVIYGHASQPTTIETRTKTNTLATLLNDRLVNQSQGLRFIAGDFNQEDGQIEVMREWVDKGWVNIQTWAQQRFGTSAVPTCHGKTVKDHVYVSPELAAYLKSVHVDSSFFADHACLWAKFEDLSRPPIIPMWKKPTKIPWDQILKTEKCRKIEETTLFKTKPMSAHAVAGLDGTSPSTLAPSEWNTRDEQNNNHNNEDLSDEFADIAKSFEMEVDFRLKANNLPSLQTHQKGRANTREGRWVQEFGSPPKQARENDLQPEYHGVDMRHAQWVRQARRCINLAQLTKQNIPIHSSKDEHRDKLWQSIQKASCFSMSFRKWWQKQMCSEMMFLPETPPNYAEACTIARIMTKHLRNFEQSLRRARISQAQQRRQNDANLVFKDIQDNPPEPVQMLVSEESSKVSEIDHEECAVIVEPSCKWKLDKPVTIGTSVFDIIHAEDDKIWLHSVENIETGHAVSQDTYVGEVTELFHQFGEAWRTRWDRHINTDDARWEPVIAVAQQVLEPPPDMPYQPIGYDEWMRALQRKKRRSAVGPEGFAKEDLINMPRCLTNRLLKMLWDIEKGSTWPIQAITGFVVSLEKVRNAKKVDQYRPITIFSIIFRTWGSIRSRQVLRHLAQVAPNTCTGNLPNKRTTDVWFGIQAQIEESIHDQSIMSGAIIDLVKAFNMLPRVPVIAILSHLKVATPILRGWSNALVHMQRRFKIRQAVGPGINSTTGFAEGDALSVTAMLGVNLMCHAWCKIRYPSIHLWSYVDNIELTCEAAEIAVQSLQGLYDFADLMDVQIDVDKTFLWSTHSMHRKAIKDAELPVRHYARDLGGHMQYTLQVTNSTITSKCAKMSQLWGKLSRSLATYDQKLRACRAKAWPRCLHAVENVHLADEHFDRLRTGVMQAIHASRKGASPLIHLSLLEDPRTDPQYHALCATVCTIRQYLTEEAISFVCDAIQNEVRIRPKPGPCSVLIIRLHQLGWKWCKNATFSDHTNHEFDLLQIPIQELKTRLRQGWQDRVRAIVSARKTMKGMCSTSIDMTKIGWEKLTPNDQAIICLNGTFFTADRMHHCKGQENTSDCKYCGALDSPFHRHWECPVFDKCRAHLTESEVAIIKTMPPCVVNHGWMPEPPSLREYQTACQNIPDQTNDFLPVTVPDDTVHVFTDGGCLAPTSGPGKLAMWGVAVGSVEQQTIEPLSQGLVKGLLQTAVRAEITAVISACKFLEKCQKLFIIFIDNDLVFKRLRRMSWSQSAIPNSQKDSDLWKDMQNCFAGIKHRCLAIVKVVSHQDVHSLQSEAEIWAAKGNAAADSIASTAVQSQPALYKLWQKYHDEVRQISIFREAVHRVFLQVGRQAVETKPKEVQHKVPANPRFVQSDLKCLQFTTSTDQEVQLRYRVSNVQEFLTWVEQLFDDNAQPQLVTWFHLNMLYEKHSGSLGFRFNKSNKRWAAVVTEHQYVGFVQRSNHFARFMKGLLESLGAECHPYHLRPNSIAIRFWTQCVYLKIRENLLEAAERAFLEFASSFASVKMLRALV